MRTRAARILELGVAIGSLTVGDDFDGVLPWRVVDNRPFLRCLYGLSRALLRLERREAATAALRRREQRLNAEESEREIERVLGKRAFLRLRTWCGRRDALSLGLADGQ